VDGCFADIEGIAHYQLSELEPGRWLLRFVPDRVVPAEALLAKLRLRLANLLELPDDSRLLIESTAALMAENSGKFRLVYPATQSPR
jgi:hypothetical protein